MAARSLKVLRGSDVVAEIALNEDEYAEYEDVARCYDPETGKWSECEYDAEGAVADVIVHITLEPNPLRAELFLDDVDEWRFSVHAGNGEIISTSEGYKNRGDAKKTAAKLVGAANVIDRLAPEA